MSEFKFSQGSNLKIGRALQQLNDWFYQRCGDWEKKDFQMWFNNDSDSCQVYYVSVHYYVGNVRKNDIYQFVCKIDNSGDIDYIEYSPEYNDKSTRINRQVDLMKDFFGLKISKREEIMKHRDGGGEPVQTFRLSVLND